MTDQYLPSSDNQAINLEVLSSVIQYFQFHEILLAERKGASSKWFVSTYQIKEGPDAFKKPSYHIEP